MSYIDSLKTEVELDRYVIFMLYLGYNKSEIADTLGITRPTVYRAIERNKELVERYKIKIEQ